MPFIVNQSVSATAGVGSQSELETALAGSDPTISLGADFSTSSQITINRTVEIKGNGHVISAAFAKTDNSNNSVIGIQGISNTVTLSNLTINGVGGTNLHGINVYVSNAVLNDVTIRDNDNTAININGSEVIVNNLKTSGHRANLSFGIIDLANGNGVRRLPKLTVNGQSQHAESGNVHIKKLSGKVIDTNSQYDGPINTFLWGYRYTLKPAPVAPVISSPTEGQEILATGTTVTWNAVAGANKYNIKLDDKVIAAGVSSNSYDLTGLVDGVSHKVEVQSVSQSGLTSVWSSARTFKITDLTPPVAPVITNSPVYVNASEPNDRARWSHSGNDVDHFEYREYRNLSDASIDKPYWIQIRAASERSQIVGQSWTSNVTLYYRIVAVDAAGNRSALSDLGTVIIDKTAPNISWQKQPDAIYGAGAGFHVRPITSEVGTTKSVYIDSITPDNLVWTLTSDHKNFDTQNTKNQALWDKLSDGEHKFIAVFKDAAGNETQSSSNVFVVDRTAPIGKISYSKINWTNSNVTATLTSNEPIKTPAGWLRVSDTEFTKKYTNNLTDSVTLTDIAGNQSTLAVSINNIDKTKPVISVDDLTLDNDNNILTSVFSATDSQSGIKTTSYAFYNTADKSGKKLIANSSANGKISIDISKLPNGTYYLHVFADDNAGNMTGDNSNPVAYSFKIYRIQNNDNNDSGSVPSAVDTNNSGSSTALSQIVRNNGSAVARTDSNTVSRIANVDTKNQNEKAQADVNQLSENNSENNNTAVLGTEDSKTNKDNARWSVINLILAALTVLMSLISLAGLVTKSKNSKRASIIRGITLIPAIGSVIAFFLIENISLAMGWFNAWTILFAVIAAIQIALLGSAKRS